MKSEKNPAAHSPVAAAEHGEAAFGGEAVANPASRIFLTHRSV
jgi:hypothetical protein